MKGWASPQTRREAIHAITFAGKFLAWLAAVFFALWTIGAAFRFSTWAGYVAVSILAVVLFVTAHIWVRWLAGLLIFSVFHSILVLTSGHGFNTPTLVSTGAASLMLLFFGVGYLILNRYGEKISVLDRCAFLVYCGSIVWMVLATPPNKPVVVTSDILYPSIVGMASIVISFTIHKMRRVHS